MSYTQDKATMEKHTKILRELVKRPGNKVCADCKRNDPRWASWNLGVFLCIRCSGLHRSMGTHISKVKSIDLDKWTPEQMASIQKWGNHLANLYWEAHLKAGHAPPEHKMESFIRSKYESRRWAKEGPPPFDPSTLDSGASTSAATAPSSSSSALTSKSAPPPPQSQNLFDMVDTESQPHSARSPVNRQPKPHHLLSASHKQQRAATSRPPVQAKAVAPAPAAPPAAPQNDLFSLDFHAPPVNSSPPPSASTKDVKTDIMSLFSSPPTQPQQQPQSAGVSGFGNFGNGAPQQGQWGWGGQQPQPQPQQSQIQQPQSAGMGQFGGMNNAAATNMWNGGGGGGTGFNAPPAQANVWASSTPAAPQNNAMFGGDTNAIWGGGMSAAAVPAPTGAAAAGMDSFGMFSSSAATATTQKKNDAFGDLWGNFK